MKTKMESFTI